MTTLVANTDSIDSMMYHQGDTAELVRYDYNGLILVCLNGKQVYVRRSHWDIKSSNNESTTGLDNHEN